MADVPITINGVICDLYGRTITGPVKIVGSMVKSGVGVGGGPIIPPEQGGGGPVDPGYGVPEHPADPGYFPPRPAHPIVLPPDPPTEPPTEPPTKPPSDNWVWGFVPDGSGGGVWKPVYVPGGGDKPQPVPPPSA